MKNKTQKSDSKKPSEAKEDDRRPSKKLQKLINKRETIVPYCERTDWSINYGYGSE